jgi:hypothetical protein
VSPLNLDLKIDENKVEVNEFVAKILSGTIIGAISSLRDVEDDWTEMTLKISK